MQALTTTLKCSVGGCATRYGALLFRMRERLDAGRSGATNT
jgi:hypothetical protein